MSSCHRAVWRTCWEVIQIHRCPPAAWLTGHQTGLWGCKLVCSGDVMLVCCHLTGRNSHVSLWQISDIFHNSDFTPSSVFKTKAHTHTCINSCVLQTWHMETIGEIIPFTKEMLNQRPSTGVLKIWVLGSSLTMLTVVGGLVEMLLLPFGEQETAEDTPAELITERTGGLEHDLGSSCSYKQIWDSGDQGQGHSCDYGTEKLNQPLTCFLKHPPDVKDAGYVDGSGGKLYHGAQLVILF